MSARITFLRTQGERDRIYVTRSDGSEVSWVFPTYGDGLPHDLVHLVVESVFSLSRGFWGRVDEGADPGRISDEANRMGGRNKHAAFGSDQQDLQLAEVLAATRWSTEDVPGQIREACEAVAVALPQDLSEERVVETRKALAALQGRWITLLPKGALSLAFDRSVPRSGLAMFGL